MYSQTVAEAYADTYTETELISIRTGAIQAHTNSTTVSMSFEGSSITVDPRNAESVLETVQEAIRIKRSKAAGADPDLSAPFRGFSLDRRYHRIV